MAALTLLAEDTVWGGLSGIIIGILIAIALLVWIIKALFPGD